MLVAASGGASASAGSTTMPEHLHDVSSRDERYGAIGTDGANVARYLLDLDDAPETTFNFCGGMMFGLVLSDALRAHLTEVAARGSADVAQPKVYGADTWRMEQRPGYTRDASADNVAVFHGREVRRVPNAAGGMGFVIHLSLANGTDIEGWTGEEIDEYAGWLSDRQRRWRDGPLLESEGFETFRTKFGPDAFTLHHRFYLHLDTGGRMWLAAEDGCEGVPENRGRDFPKARSPLSFFG